MVSLGEKGPGRAGKNKRGERIPLSVSLLRDLEASGSYPH